MKKIFPVLLMAVLVIAIILAMVVRLPYNVRGKGMVKPLQEWGLYKSSDGTLVNILENHLHGSIHEYKVLEFQRGDMVSFLFNEALIRDKIIQQGDTIAWIMSHDLDMRMVEMHGDMLYQEALLEVYLTGEKPEAIRMALDEVELARQELTTQKKLTGRIENLYQQDLVSRQEYELSMNDLQVKQYALEIAQSNYRALLAGEKEEELGVIRSRIASLSDQISQLAKQKEAMNILSPITGHVIRQQEFGETSSDQVIRVADMSSFLVFVPVDIHEKIYIQAGQQVRIRANNRHPEIIGKVVGMDNAVQLINRRPKVFVSVLTGNPAAADLLPNMIVDARITTDTLRLKDYLFRQSRVVYQN